MADKPTTFEEFSYFGLWWLPEDENKTWAGTLTYKPRSGIELELLVPTEQLDFSPDLPESAFVILGELPQSPYRITLFKNYRVAGEFSTKTRLTPHRYYTDYLLAGEWFESRQQIILNSVDVTYSSLLGWKGSEPSFDSEYKWEESIPIKSIGANVVLKDRASTTHSSNEHRSVRKCSIRIEPDKPHSVAWFHDQINSIRDLLAFLAGIPVESKHVIGELCEAGSNSSEVEIYYPIHPPEEDELQYFKMAFPHWQLGDKVPCVFQAWFGRKEEARIPFDLSLDIIFGKDRYSKSEFLTLIQALESFHRNVCKKESLPLPSGKKKWDLLDRLNYLYGDLPDWMQMDFVSDPNWDFERILEEGMPKWLRDDEVLKWIKDSRVHYTHYPSQRHRERALKGVDLYNAVARLIPFIAYFLYRELGIPNETINSAFTQIRHRGGLWQRPKLKQLGGLNDDTTQ